MTFNVESLIVESNRFSDIVSRAANVSSRTLYKQGGSVVG